MDMNTNDLYLKWSNQSFTEIEEQILREEANPTITRLLGADTVAEIQAHQSKISFSPIRENVVLLPGIMGSILSSIRGITNLLWINPLLFLQGNAHYLRLDENGIQDENPRIEVAPTGLEKLTYLKISLALNRRAVLHEFPYDWRRPIEHNADALAAMLQRWAADNDYKFTLVAHSMGGLVARACFARHPQIAEKTVRRLIQLGSPNYGAPNAIETLLHGNTMMAAADQLNRKNAMRDLVYNLPSVYQLLPAPGEYLPAGSAQPVNFDLYRAEEWGLPSIRQKYLDSARLFHQLLAESASPVPVDVIAGCHIETIVQFHKTNAHTWQPKSNPQGEQSGDGTVPLWSARLNGARVFYIQEKHRDLPNNRTVIDAVLDIIHSATCDLPETLPAPKPFSFESAPSPDIQAESLREKIESGTIDHRDLQSLYFAL
ncbi:MAG: hypothetical protein AB1453_05830 [Chloroflexota bacterium]